MGRRAALPVLVLLIAVTASAAAPPAAPDADRAKIEALLNTMNEVQKGLHTLRVSFVQTNHFQMLAKPQVLKGTLILKKPDTALYAYSYPSRLSYLVKDGDLLMVDEAAKKVVVQDIRRHQNKIMRYLAVGQPIEELTRHFQVNALGEANGSVHLELVPLKVRARRKISALHFWVDSKTALLRALEIIEPEGDRIRFEFSDWDTNPVLTEADFKVEIPKGSRVQRQLLDVDQPFGN
jgi:outer membrane lipoprotein-sorting protein